MADNQQKEEKTFENLTKTENLEEAKNDATVIFSKCFAT